MVLQLQSYRVSFAFSIRSGVLEQPQTDFVKNRVAIEVQFGKYAFVAYDLFVKHLAFYIGNHIDEGIKILPIMKESYIML
jgi:hypothetical protein